MPPKKKTDGAPTAVPDDVSMKDASPAPAPGGEETDVMIMDDEDRKFRVLPGGEAQASSFAFKEEDHTLGNALRYIIMKNPDVEFCGYSIPHPSEAVMHIRIQTYEGTAIDALSKGLADLADLCDVVAAKFLTAREQFGRHDDPEGFPPMED